MSDQQTINVMLHDERKLFHVSVHNTYKQDGRTPNPNIGWARSAVKAKYAYEQIKIGKLGPSRSLEAGLAIALVNTDYTGWRDDRDFTAYSDFNYAQPAKDNWIRHWEGKGYKNVGVRNVNTKTSNPGVPIAWNKRFPSSMTQSQITHKIKLMEVSLGMVVPDTVKVNAYKELALTRKPSLGFEVENMATLFRFVRESLHLY
jgi:hypothetical protein